MLAHAVSFGLSEPRLVLDREGRILNWNEDIERILGERVPLQGRRLGELLRGGDARALAEWLADLDAHQGRSLLPQALTLWCPDGGARRVALTGQGMCGKAGFCLLVQVEPEPSCGVLAALEHHPVPAAVLWLLDPSDPESLVFLGFNAAARAQAGPEIRALAGRCLAQALPLARERGWLPLCAAVARGGPSWELDLASLSPQSGRPSSRVAVWPLPERCVGVSLVEAIAPRDSESRAQTSRRNAEDHPAPATVWAPAEGADAPAAASDSQQIRLPAQ